MRITPQTPSTIPAVCMEDPSQGEQRIRSWVGALVRVSLDDDRVIEGAFQCVDKFGNVVLGQAKQVAPDSAFSIVRLHIPRIP